MGTTTCLNLGSDFSITTHLMWHTIGTKHLHTQLTIEWSIISWSNNGDYGNLREKLCKFIQWFHNMTGVRLLQLNIKSSLKLQQFLHQRECRRSARISELDARRAQQFKRQIEGNGPIKLGMTQDSRIKKGSYQTLGRKRKTRPVHDLVDSNVHCEAQKACTWNWQDHHRNGADMSSSTGIPDRKKLELLLNKLKRRDFYRIFAEPVDPLEVEGYYDVIKEPMDFSTITEKLNRGSYRTLEEFEHDITLVYNNAMHFNASDSLYYKQGHAIKELAYKLFHTLKTNPNSFENERSIRSVGPGRRTKAVSGSLNCNICNKTNCNETVSKGHREERGSQNFGQPRRWSYTPHTLFLNENEPSVTEVYNTSKNLEPVKENKIGYAKSIMRFANNLGPTAQIVAARKLERGIAGNSKPQMATSSCHLQAPNNQIPAVASAHKNISTAPPLKFPGNSAVGTVGIYDVLRAGILQASSTMKKLGEICAKRLHAQNNQMTSAASARKRITVAPSLIVHGHSAGDMSTAFKEQISTSGDSNLEVPAEWNTSRNPNKFSYVKLMLDANMDSPDQTAAVVSSGLELQELIPAGFSSPLPSWQLPFQSMPGGSSRSQATGFIHDHGVLQKQTVADWEGPNFGGSIEQGGKDLNSFNLNVGGGPSSSRLLNSIQGVDFQYLGLDVVPQIQVNEAGPSHGGKEPQGSQVSNWFKSTGSGADGAGPSHGNMNGRKASNWFKPTQLGPEPVPDDWFQQHSRSLSEVLLYQAEPLQQQAWAITPCYEKTMKAADTSDYGKCETSRPEELIFGAPADNSQNQPLLDFSMGFLAVN